MLAVFGDWSAVFLFFAKKKNKKYLKGLRM